jgi:hypothetical protein
MNKIKLFGSLVAVVVASGGIADDARPRFRTYVSGANTRPTKTRTICALALTFPRAA